MILGNIEKKILSITLAVVICIANLTLSYSSELVETGNYKVVICAKVNGKWDTGSINQRAFTVKIA